MQSMMRIKAPSKATLAGVQATTVVQLCAALGLSEAEIVELALRQLEYGNTARDSRLRRAARDKAARSFVEARAAAAGLSVETLLAQEGSVNGDSEVGE